MTGARLARAALRALSPLLGEARAERLVARVYALVYLVVYYLAAQYGRALLGTLWAVLTPALFLAVYLPILTYVFHASLPGATGPYDYAIFIVSGFLPWGAFAEGLGQGTSSLVNNVAIVRHAPIPPGILPTIKVTSAFAGFLLALVVFLPVLAFLGRFPGARLVLLPVAVGLFYAFTLGLTWAASSLAVLARDLLQLVPTLLMVEFFACPIIYSPESAPPRLAAAIGWNPLTPFLALHRAALSPGAPFAWADLAACAAWAGGALVVGLATFRLLEDRFGDSA